jgi:GntR family transcriptional regulator
MQNNRPLQEALDNNIQVHKSCVKIRVILTFPANSGNFLLYLYTIVYCGDLEMTPLDKASVQPLYAQLEGLLRHQIERGDWRPGDRVLSEQELANRYDISRMTARKALTMLVTDGVLVRHPGKGTFVAQAKVPAASTLTSFSTAMRDLGLTVSSKVVEKSITKPSPAVRDTLELLPGEQVIYLRRVRYIEAEPVAIMSSHMPASYYAALLNEDLTGRPLTAVMEAINSDLKISSSRDYFEAAGAREEEAQLLDIKPDAPVLLERGVVYAQNDVPVRSSKVIYRGDRFRLNLSAGQQADTQVKINREDKASAAPEWYSISYELGE